MDKTKSLLTICIPTYNRADCLDSILELMCPLCQENMVMICISDNASSDNTSQIVENYAQKYDIVRYHRHERNIGSDDNFEFVLKMADTKYRWLMSDTCYIDEVETVLNDLSHSDFDAYILNGGDGTRHQYLPKQKKVYQDPISLMDEIGWHLTWISCMIYNEWMIKSMDFKRYRDSCFNQTALMFDPLANKRCNICFNADFRVQNLTVQKESGWLYHVFDIMYRQWYLLIMSLPIYYPYKTKIKCISDSANKAALLGLYFHMKRRGEGKWNLHDVIKNKTFIKQADGGYYRLLLLGLSPQIVARWITNAIDMIIRLMKKNNKIRMIGKRVLNYYISKK